MLEENSEVSMWQETLVDRSVSTLSLLLPPVGRQREQRPDALAMLPTGQPTLSEGL